MKYHPWRSTAQIWPPLHASQTKPSWKCWHQILPSPSLLHEAEEGPLPYLVRMTFPRRRSKLCKRRAQRNLKVTSRETASMRIIGQTILGSQRQFNHLKTRSVYI